MNTMSQFDENSDKRKNTNSPSGNTIHTNKLTGLKDMVKRDCFELLSAYLDGEVTAAERRQVEELLSNDQSVQKLYRRLLSLRQGLRNIPVPEQQPVEETVQQVFSKLNRRSQRLWLVRGAAIAACAIGAVAGLMLGNEGSMEFAQNGAESTQQAVKPAAPKVAPLMVALNQPVIPIPKAAEAAPETPFNQLKAPQPPHSDRTLN
jgi:anti-sigma factor RsiW